MSSLCGIPRLPTYATNISRGIGKVLCTALSLSSSDRRSSAQPSNSRSGSSNVSEMTRPSFSAGGAQHLVSAEKEAARRKANIRYKAVPSTRIGRAANFGSLFMQLGWEKISGGNKTGGKFSAAGHERIVETLCRMRGSVLKLGQMLSIQDSETVPPHVTALFAKVRDQAFAMPNAQLRSTLAKEFNDPAWREKLFEELDEVPVAAASIGQVHWGRLKKGTNSETGEVAIKVQYPGVAQSIDSDIKNLKTLLTIGIMPPGMFVDQILRELRAELMQECQYLLEAEKQMRYAKLIEGHPTLSQFFHVPKVYMEHSTQQMLVSEYVHGVPIDKITKEELEVSDDYRSYVATQLLTLTLNELFEWRFMQTDPNFSNFLFDSQQNKVHLLDFGAAREYPADFVTDYLEVVAAAARQDRAMVIEKSVALGFLTGREGREMLDAHVESVMLLGKPFRNRDENYDFASENIPGQVQKLVPTMVRLRLKPPPMPAYSLHRRLSGTILLCTRLKASVPSGKIFWEMYDRKHAEVL